MTEEPTPFMLEQAAALQARADTVGALRSQLQDAAERRSQLADEAWLRFADVDNEWQALMSAVYALQQPRDHHETLRRKIKQRARADRTVTEDDGEAA